LRFNKIDETDDMIKRKTFIIFDPRNREIEEKILNKTQNNSVVIKFEYVFLYLSFYIYRLIVVIKYMKISISIKN